MQKVFASGQETGDKKSGRLKYFFLAVSAAAGIHAAVKALCMTENEDMHKAGQVPV